MNTVEGGPPVAIKALRLIFWGGLLCLFDVSFSQTTNGTGFKFDILNDLVGMLMITFGVSSLARATVHARYDSAMRFVKVVAIAKCVTALDGHFIYAAPSWLGFVSTAFGIVVLIAIVRFCIAMRWLSEESRFPVSAGSWKTTTVLFVVIYAVPLGLFYVAALIAMATGTSFHFDLGPLAIPILIVFAIPLIHLFVSTSRMKREAEERLGSPEPAAVFE